MKLTLPTSIIITLCQPPDRNTQAMTGWRYRQVAIEIPDIEVDYEPPPDWYVSSMKIDTFMRVGVDPCPVCGGPMVVTGYDDKDEELLACQASNHEQL